MVVVVERGFCEEYNNYQFVFPSKMIDGIAAGILRWVEGESGNKLVSE